MYFDYLINLHLHLAYFFHLIMSKRVFKAEYEQEFRGIKKSRKGNLHSQNTRNLAQKDTFFKKFRSPTARIFMYIDRYSCSINYNLEVNISKITEIRTKKIRF